MDKNDNWIRPWNLTKFDDLYNRDDRFFSLLIKGAISFLNRNILMYNKSINHFIYNTGSSYMYVENNGYEFSWNETSGEDMMYMQLPRCVIEMGAINIETSELSQGFSRGNYERKTQDNLIKGYNAEIKRIPLSCGLTLHYVLGNFNECIILVQEIIDQLTFQKYFKINYLGNIIQCSIELPQDFNINLNKIDLAAPDTTQRTIDINLTLNTNYPLINEESEINSAHIISSFGGIVTTSDTPTDIIVYIDDVQASNTDVFLDLNKFDLNKDGIIDEREINIVKEFLNNFDIDKDGYVTQHDIDIIEEDFINNIYNIKYDILNKGVVDMMNLSAIKALFKEMDFNNDTIISDFEVKKILYIVEHLTAFDFDNDLLISYKDLNNMNTFITKYYCGQYINYHKDFLYYYNTSVKIDSLKQIILNILIRNNINYNTSEVAPPDADYSYIDDIDMDTVDIDSIDITSTSELIYLIQHKFSDIDEDTLKELIENFNQLMLFKKYDTNNDGVLDEKDIDNFVNNLSDYTRQKITYYAGSSIYIHRNDKTFSPSSVTDVVNIIKKIDKDQYEE